MKLIIGGYSQGKLNYVLQKEAADNYVIFDGMLPEDQKLHEAARQEKKVIINHFHNWVKERISQGKSPEEEVYAFVKKCPDCTVISDEIGNGIVPIDAFEREYRERTGRILVELASQADEVVRVICGIGQKIK